MTTKNTIMVKASELRIGNVIWDVSRKKYKMVNHRVIADLASNNNPLPYEYVALTESVLIKCGFTKKRSFDDYWFEKGKNKIRFLTNDTIYNRRKDQWYIGFYLLEGDQDSLFFKHIKYLHQFQNLYYILTETELQVSLFTLKL